MAATKINLDVQTDKYLTEPTVDTRARLKDAAAVNSLFLDWDEPAGADRTVNFEDPGANDTVAYLDATQVFQNKQISTPAAVGDDITNKTYVDGAVSAATPDATAGSGGATKGVVTFDSDKGLDVVAGVAEVKIDGVSITFNGLGQLVGAAAPPDATAASGGGVKGIATYDSDKGLDVAAGVAEVKVDGTSVGFNVGGQLEVISAPNTGIPTASNKEMAASTTALDGDLACATAMALTPTGGGYVRVDVNGISVIVGDGVKTKDCYFSNDGGATARAIAAIAAGDLLYWNGTAAGYQLSAITDIIDFSYDI